MSRSKAPAGPLTKRCLDCGETKPLSEFHRNKSRKDGRHMYCAECNRQRARASAARRRERMGEAEWLEHQRQILARSRERRDSARERQYARAKYRAVQRLIEAHPRQFEALFAAELDAEERKAS